MKRLLVTIATCVLLTLGCVGGVGVALAQPSVGTLWPNLLSAEPPASSDVLLEQMRSQLLPQFESILSSEQRDRLQAEIVDAKASLRKAFKKIALSTDQKTKLASVFKSLPKKDIFASLTPEQKKGLFSKKEMFMPTPEAISDKINAKMQMAKDNGAMMPTSAEISQKISAKMQLAKDKAAAKMAPAPTVEKATEALNAIESKVAE
ncbi:hypothetical protein [Stenomitos frigidus]|uniref:LTXXQ motif family protein n=1 Tax=Stenomitos frigidus ULC18 TaxID=2107698 RepID=A0A2T1DVC5_9CYAN|nr:hypothetical protein [Stenomitos frigidus]PSB24466.1 hypothetical protein C7B82_27005 [Stenomitos frigidus ULC18]